MVIFNRQQTLKIIW